MYGNQGQGQGFYNQGYQGNQGWQGNKGQNRSRSRSGSGKHHGHGHGHHGHHGSHGHHGHHGHHHNNQGGYNQGGYNQGGYNQGGYNQGFQPGNDRDQQLRNSIDQIFYKYDRDNSGFLEEKEFRACIGQLCRMLNKPEPQSYQEFLQIARSIDVNNKGRINKMDLFNLFKRVTGY